MTTYRMYGNRRRRPGAASLLAATAENVRSGFDRALLMIGWRRAHKRGENTYDSTTVSRIPGGKSGTLCIPAVFASAVETEPFGMIRMPQVDGYTVVLDAHRGVSRG